MKPNKFIKSIVEYLKLKAGKEVTKSDIYKIFLDGKSEKNPLKRTYVEAERGKVM